MANVLFKDRKHIFTYGRAKDENLDKLIDLLIEYSPLEIVNSAGYHIKPAPPPMDD
jgi:hypothetical protein